MISRKFAYADDLALLHSSGNWKDLEGTLSQDMSTLLAYLQTWRLKLSHTKTVTAAFHLNNRETKRELKVYNNDRLLAFCPTPTYLVVKLDTSLTFRHHLVALRKKLSSRVALLRRLVGSGLGAGAKTLRIATLSLVYSTPEYCAPVWCRSALTLLIDSVLNDALRIVTGCLRPTPTNHLPIPGCEQLVTCPTRVSFSRKSILDHIYIDCSMFNEIFTTTVIECDISDHYPIFVGLNLPLKRKNTRRPLIRKILPEKIENFLNELDSTLKKNVPTNISDLTTCMTKVTNNLFPKTRQVR